MSDWKILKVKIDEMTSGYQDKINRRRSSSVIQACLHLKRNQTVLGRPN